MSDGKGAAQPFSLDPGAFNAALFEAYKGTCNCPVCKILRSAVEDVVGKYIPKAGP